MGVFTLRDKLKVNKIFLIKSLRCLVFVGCKERIVFYLWGLPTGKSNFAYY